MTKKGVRKCLGFVIFRVRGVPPSFRAPPKTEKTLFFWHISPVWGGFVESWEGGPLKIDLFRFAAVCKHVLDWLPWRLSPRSFANSFFEAFWLRTLQGNCADLFATNTLLIGYLYLQISSSYLQRFSPLFLETVRLQLGRCKLVSEVALAGWCLHFASNDLT